ncbi:MAG: EamA family transporter [Anaerolineae bacterium]
MTPTTATTPRRWLARLCGDNMDHCLRLAAAFAAVYVIWGSTYLAIRIAIETMPPFAMAGIRFVIAGALLYGWQRWRGAPAPLRIHWRSATIIGALLLLGGNGGVTWAEQEIPSGLAALIIATVPIWIVVFGALRPGTPRPSRRTLAGVLLGMAGIALLIGPSDLAADQQIRTISYVALLLSPMLWALGSLYSRAAPGCQTRSCRASAWRCWPAVRCCCWPPPSPANGPPSTWPLSRCARLWLSFT